MNKEVYIHEQTGCKVVTGWFNKTIKELFVVDPGTTGLQIDTELPPNTIKNKEWKKEGETLKDSRSSEHKDMDFYSNRERNGKPKKRRNKGGVAALEKLKDVLSKVEFRDWEFHTDRKSDHAVLKVLLKDHQGNYVCGREWPVYYYMSESEIVKTVFSAIRQASTHEDMKDFEFNGTRVFSPYFNVRGLSKVKEEEPPQDIDF